MNVIMVPSSIGRDYCGPWKTPSNQQYKVVFCVDKRSLLNLQSPKKLTVVVMVVVVAVVRKTTAS